ncbi:AAA family ATPase [Saccharothrix sp. HUAS TT1]|uniref:AAA family ATPase n=1 Tax=unclassified Saccharothrix TaxID=2593673 RepID=UPI00345BDB1E
MSTPRTLDRAAGRGGRLLGRERECASARGRVEAVEVGVRQLLMIRGDEGVGKSRLLDEVLDTAVVPAGTTILRARCDPELRNVSYGVARDLLGCPSGLPGQPDAPAIMHYLYRRAADLMASGPLVLAVDDLHWSDEDSLDWLGYLIRRSWHRPLCLALTARTPLIRPITVLRGAFLGAGTTTIDLGPLPTDAVDRLVTEALGDSVDEGVLTEVRRLSGGNSLLLTRLLARLADGSAPAVGVEVVITSVVDWLLAQRPQVARVARAIAVLETGDPDLVAALSGVPTRAVSGAADLLRSAGLLVPGGDGFVHDLVREAVLTGLSGSRVVHMRTRAARLLNDAGRPAEVVASHLLRLPAPDKPWMRAVLRAAADDSARRGAPRAAARFLLPLVDAMPGDAALRAGLAGLLAHDDPSSALRHLDRALADAPDPRLRARIAVQHGKTALALQRSPDATRVLETALDALVEAAGPTPSREDRELLHHVRASLFMSAVDEKSTVRQARDRVLRLGEPAGGTPAERQLLAVLAVSDAIAGHPVERAVRRAERALLLDEAACGGWTALASAFVLDLADDTAAAVTAVDRLVTRSRAEGAAWAHRVALGTRATLLCGAGNFTSAGVDARLALKSSRHRTRRSHPVQPAVTLAHVLVREGAARRAADLLAAVEHPGLDDLLFDGHLFRMARASARAELGDAEGALADLSWCGRSLAGAGVANPVFAPWWAEAALLLADQGRTAEAEAHVEHGERLTANWDVPRARGLVLLTRAAVEKGSTAVESMTEAVRVLEASSARYDLQRAEHRLGSALLRRGDTREAREHLRRAADLATLCGAPVAAARARALLLKAGGRMRNLTGNRADILTDSERRVARLAVGGATNREIAEALFVTARTVEVHLTSAYRKLGITGRAELATVFAGGEGD